LAFVENVRKSLGAGIRHRSGIAGDGGVSGAASGYRSS
jgi:hypothetical protein